jgi:hypothetical protein
MKVLSKYRQGHSNARGVFVGSALSKIGLIFFTNQHAVELVKYLYIKVPMTAIMRN